MYTPSINTLLAMGLLFSAPLTSALVLRSINQDSVKLITARGIAVHDIAARNIATLMARHRTGAQNGAKKGAAGGNATTVSIDNKAGNSTAKAGKKGKAGKNGRAQLFVEREAHYTEV
ncbi:hypothetical protein DID88_003679 [Monilinia fructigena]|uniref:Uncharacterized protein n=1 Tax=Monilinia fructigena TaxID=38457 RepID=A0A395ITK2_9HELO|nr:hypothetical protein DID88_003679 [Monilinia fructigena]